jgi:hypothetical protein
MYPPGFAVYITLGITGDPVSTQATDIRCRGCDFKGVISYREITLRYHFPSGNTVTSYRDRGWCHSCETNRDIERPLDLGEIEDKIQEFQQQKPRGLFASIFGLGSQKRESDLEVAKNLQAVLHLAKNRKSPPRCLNCGSDRTLPLEFGSNGLSLSFIHYCGERLFTLPPDENAPRISRRPLELDLDSEGNLLGSSDA